MEHRWSLRKAIELDVTVSRRGDRMRARCQDVGLEGMYLEVPAHGLKENNAVELAFVLGEGRGARVHRVKAFVVRKERDGVGVMFLEFLSHAFRQIEELIYGPGSPGYGPRLREPERRVSTPSYRAGNRRREG